MKLFMRVEGQRELCVGSAASVTDVPWLLRRLADRWESNADRSAPLYATRTQADSPQ